MRNTIKNKNITLCESDSDNEVEEFPWPTVLESLEETLTKRF